MPCYHLREAWLTPGKTYFQQPSIIDSRLIKLPCKQCIGCRLEKSREWAIRLMHEYRFHTHTSFITLTYDEQHLPHGGSLNFKHFQDFMKRLRKQYNETKIRFYHAGEYGERRGRPHYHAIIFGHDFEDRIPLSTQVNDRGDETWQSQHLADLWPHGAARVGRVTFESCAYVARYITKKVNGANASQHYQNIDQRTGEVHRLKPEYATMSRRPGIGHQHLHKYKQEIYDSDEVILMRNGVGHASKPPNYYDRLLEKLDPDLYAEIKDERECALSLSSIYERSPKRLFVKETVKTAQIHALKRSYELG